MLPHRLEVATPEGVEVWVFGRWTETAAAGLVLPGTSHQTHPAGNSCVFDMTTAESVRGGAEERKGGEPGGSEENASSPSSSSSSSSSSSASSSVFAQPYVGYPPGWPPPAYEGGGDDETTAAAAAAGGAETETIAARGEGGHVLVVPRLGGGGGGDVGSGAGAGATATPGWFVLDTSCAGYAVDPAAADACGMPAFGELSVVGVSAAALNGRMRRGGNISLGACTVPAPLYMEQALGAALRTPPMGDGGGGGGLVGVLGTDFLQHCVVGRGASLSFGLTSCYNLKRVWFRTL